jgi:hypothetical protein
MDVHIDPFPAFAEIKKLPFIAQAENSDRPFIM